ncbi:hypothetical protein Hypma_016373 [Hypsizygus marmoreus]|uniref:Uncharacterized protein n=1 Tax=Hypsizygus marmoreus TaxID=39966 RepID=A0A369IYK5_HYPMA|nr:hypothetical protein Hypma_016373 [Hypsizygus marmoreus]
MTLRNNRCSHPALSPPSLASPALSTGSLLNTTSILPASDRDLTCTTKLYHCSHRDRHRDFTCTPTRRPKLHSIKQWRLRTLKIFRLMFAPSSTCTGICTCIYRLKETHIWCQSIVLSDHSDQLSLFLGFFFDARCRRGEWPKRLFNGGPLASYVSILID